jgi:hypothetical protein
MTRTMEGHDLRGNFAMESVASFAWNRWQLSYGTGGNFRAEYARSNRHPVATRAFSWYGMGMDKTPFDLTPEQKGLLAALSHETGKPIHTLVAKALEELQEHERPRHGHGETNGHETDTSTPSPAAYTPIWERIRETFSNLSEEDLASLPADGAAHVDHYAYGLPKR